MQLKELLKDIYDGSLDVHYNDCEITSIVTDSRKVQKQSLFFALKGAQYNGADFIDMAIQKGARVIIGEEPQEKLNQENDICYLAVNDPQKLLRKVATRFYNNPSECLHAIGITGTNGKTTISYLLEAILKRAHLSCGVIGTVNYRVGEKIFPAPNTTPALIDNQILLEEMVAEGAEYCVMEVSSHALDQDRVDLINFKSAIFTNLTSDHLDYHKTTQNYFAAKSKLFINQDSDAAAIINIDDQYGRKLVSKTPARVITYGIENNAQVMAKDIVLDMNGTRFKLVSDEGEVVIQTKLVGTYNVYNILAAVATSIDLGISLDKIKAAIDHMNLVPGRLEAVRCEQDYTILIDYAHTQDALENVLRMINQTTDARVILVFGCGGDRDRSKRAAMGKVADQWADFTFVTSDNPRTEEPLAIIHEIVHGFDSENYRVVVEREKAIRQALDMAQKGDVVLIAGKGHEDYQIFKDRTIKFDEREVIRQYLRC